MTPTHAPGADGAAALQATTHLVYLHGFRSSPASFKAQRLQRWLASQRPDVRWCCPQLPPSPREALALIGRETAGWPAATSAVVGSSLGGWYATAVGIRRGWPTVVINPAVNPARDLARYIDEQLPAFHAPDDADAGFFFRREFVDELLALQPPPGALPARCLAIIADGDETLDPAEMRSRYAGAEVHRVAGSDHALSDFDEHLPVLLRFLQLETPTPCD